MKNVRQVPCGSQVPLNFADDIVKRFLHFEPPPALKASLFLCGCTEYLRIRFLFETFALMELFI